jgi:NADP-dependent 3-hydroxy acid dehydrogenase YdfG
VTTEFAKASDLEEDILEALKHIPSLTATDIADAVLYVLGTPAHVQVGRLDFMYRLRLRCAVKRLTQHLVSPL